MGEISMSGSTREREAAVIGLRASHPVLSSLLYWLLVPFLGQDFFPSVDAGTFRLHVRAHSGTRLEATATLIDHVEESTWMS